MYVKKANNHGYEVRTTATDASSQNGIVERPHRTLKEKMQCMLYSARLGTEFWADAITHTTWLYNQTYHSAGKKHHSKRIWARYQHSIVSSHWRQNNSEETRNMTDCY